jgi:hypothetical protein
VTLEEAALVRVVPQERTVSMVTPFAGAPRLAITGWFTA